MLAFALDRKERRLFFLTLRGAIWRAFCVTLLLLVTSCARPPTPDSVPLLEQVFVEHLCWRPGALTIYPSLDPSEYTVNASTLPRFSISGGPERDDRVSESFFIVASELARTRGCNAWAIIGILTDNPDAIEILPVGDWRVLAGEDAVDALDQLVTECTDLSAEEAFALFGDDTTHDPVFDLTRFQTSENVCRMAVQSLAYGLRIRSPDGEVIISNVFGQFFVEDLST